MQSDQRLISQYTTLPTVFPSSTEWTVSTYRYLFKKALPPPPLSLVHGCFSCTVRNYNQRLFSPGLLSLIPIYTIRAPLPVAAHDRCEPVRVSLYIAMSIYIYVYISVYTECGSLQEVGERESGRRHRQSAKPSNARRVHEATNWKSSDRANRSSRVKAGESVPTHFSCCSYRLELCSYKRRILQC